MGCKACGRYKVNPLLSFDQSMVVGDFLARLWARFGPPDPRDDGFSYDLLDKQTGFEFNAYSGPNGPSYGAYPQCNRDKLFSVLSDFERWISNTPPVDCEFIYTSFQEEKMDVKVGMRDGKPFEEILTPFIPTPESDDDYWFD